MECPNCHKELSASDHCIHCNWKAESLINQPDTGEPKVSALSAGEAAKAPAPAPIQSQDLGQVAESPSAETIPPSQLGPTVSPSHKLAGPDAQTPAESVDRVIEQTEKKDYVPAALGEPDLIKQPTVKADLPAQEHDGPVKTKKKSGQDQTNKVHGTENIIAQVYNAYYGKEPRQEPEAYLSITEATVKLPPNSSDLPRITFDRHEFYLQTLKTERLILISCADQDLTYAAAYALIDNLEIQSDERKRFLNFDRLLKEHLDFDIYSFFKKSAPSKPGYIIVVDAFSDKSQTFIDSLFNAGRGSSDNIKEDLARARLFVICVLTPEEIEIRVKSYKDPLRFTHWELPFLPLLLTCYQPAVAVEELQTILLEQQGRGNWSRDNTEFARQIKAALKSNRLSEEIAQRAETPQPLNVSALSSEGDKLIRLILYVATYFPGLSPSEFNQVMDVLLDDRTETVAITSTTTGADGKTVIFETQVERKLRQRWEQSPDNLLKNCQLVTNGNSIHTIAFFDDRLGLRQKELFEKEYRLYLRTEFKNLQQCGLLFDVSEKVAEQVMRLILEMMLAFPGDYGRDWLLTLVMDLLGQLDAAENETLSRSDRTAQFLKKSWGDRFLRQFYARLAQLLRKMLEHPNLVEVVGGLLEQLIVARRFTAVPELIARGLGNGPGFDKFYWVKQVVDRGDETARKKAQSYLYGEIKKDQQIYEVLRALEAWLPEPERSLDHFSLSNNFALQVMLDYCLETTFEFEPKDYGAWHKHPLLAVRNLEEASRNFDLLMRWLFHPGMKRILAEVEHLFVSSGLAEEDDFAGDSKRLFSAVFTKWAFILCGQPEVSAQNASVRDESGAPQTAALGQESEPAAVKADDLLEILLSQIFSHTDKLQQTDLLDYWQGLNDDLLAANDFMIEIIRHYDKSLRQEIKWKRKLVSRLQIKFRGLQRQHRKSQR